MSQSPASEWSCGHSGLPGEWNVTDCLRILWRRKAGFLWITGMVALGAAAITGTQPLVYESEASVEVQTLNENFLNLRTVYPADASKVETGLYVQTQGELLEQDSLIEAVARQLHLDQRPEFQPPTALMDKLREAIRIVPVHNTRLIRIVCDARSPSLAAELANNLARTFIEQDIETRQRGARETYQSLQGQLEGLAAGANRHVYQALMQQANDARTASAVRQSNIRLIAPAQAPTLPSKPNLPLNLAIGIVDGFLLAIGFVLLSEQTRPVLRAPGEGRSCLGLPELGAIPDAGPFDAPGLLPLNHPLVAEAFRGALASILSKNGGSPRVLVVTSSRAREGKTTAVGSLGIALAEIGRKTLLIDADIASPRLHEIFDQSNVCGLSDVLGETNAVKFPLNTLIKKTAVPNLCLLPAGPPSIWMPARLNGIPPLFQQLREEFDYVLVDTPPCLECIGACNLATYADGFLLVVQANGIDPRTAQAAARRLESGGSPVLGIILNRL